MLKTLIFAGITILALPGLSEASGSGIQVLSYADSGDLSHADTYTMRADSAGLYTTSCEGRFSIKGVVSKGPEGTVDKKFDTTTLVTIFALAGVSQTKSGLDYLAGHNRFARLLFLSNEIQPDQLTVYAGFKPFTVEDFLKDPQGVPISFSFELDETSFFPNLEELGPFEQTEAILRAFRTPEGQAAMLEKLGRGFHINIATDSLWTVAAQKQAAFWETSKLFERLNMPFQIEPEDTLPSALAPQQIGMELGRVNTKNIARMFRLATMNLIRQAIAFNTKPEDAFFFGQSISESRDYIYRQSYGLTEFAKHHFRISLADALKSDLYRPRFVSRLVADYAKILPNLSDFDLIKLHTSLCNAFAVMLDYRKPVIEGRAENPPLFVLDYTVSGSTVVDRLLLDIGATAEQTKQIEHTFKARANVGFSQTLLSDTSDQSVIEEWPARNVYVYNLDAEAAALSKHYLADVLGGLHRWRVKKATDAFGAQQAMPLIIQKLAEANVGINVVTRKPIIRDGLIALGGSVKEHRSVDKDDAVETIYVVHFDAAPLIQLSRSQSPNQQSVVQGYWQRRNELGNWIL